MCALLLAAPRALDIANGYYKEHQDCRILWVIDGDTVKAVCPKSGYVSARIMGFDTPEKRARCLREAWMAFAASFQLRMLLYQAEHIRTWPRGLDRYGRQLVVVAVDGAGLADQMTASGYARPYFGGLRRGWCEGQINSASLVPKASLFLDPIPDGAAHRRTGTRFGLLRM